MENGNKIVSAEEAMRLVEAATDKDDAPWVASKVDNMWWVRMGHALVAECGDETDAKLIEAAPHLARTVIALHKRIVERDQSALDDLVATIGTLTEERDEARRERDRLARILAARGEVADGQ